MLANITNIGRARPNLCMMAIMFSIRGFAAKRMRSLGNPLKMHRTISFRIDEMLMSAPIESMNFSPYWNFLVPSELLLDGFPRPSRIRWRNVDLPTPFEPMRMMPLLTRMTSSMSLILVTIFFRSLSGASNFFLSSLICFLSSSFCCVCVLSCSLVSRHISSIDSRALALWALASSCCRCRTANALSLCALVASCCCFNSSSFILFSREASRCWLCRVKMV
mmetsp:Transcript_39792/g.77358  ORF Transcript_39792/g.77358 Transcript_39792/m.77358 type:complete len:221 (-) Transcript_39792:186-848(-)